MSYVSPVWSTGRFMAFPIEAIDWASAWTPRYRWKIATRPETQITHTPGGRQSLAPVDINTKQRQRGVQAEAQSMASIGKVCRDWQPLMERRTIVCYLGGIWRWFEQLSVPYKSLYFECYATMPMLADAHISSLGYLWCTWPDLERRNKITHKILWQRKRNFLQNI